MWAELTIGNWIVITRWLPSAIGGAEPFTEQSALVVGGSRGSIVNPRWRAEGVEQQMGKISVSPPFPCPNDAGCLLAIYQQIQGGVTSFVEVEGEA